MNTLIIRLIFLLAGLYDLGLGIAFLGNAPLLFERFDVPAPNHWGYVQFAALLLIIFGVMFLMVALQPYSNRNVIPYGVMLKLAYSTLVGYYWFTSDIPLVFKVFAVADAIMLVLFAAAFVALGRQRV